MSDLQGGEAMTGIADMFTELAEADSYCAQAQLELWGWRRRAYQREWLAAHRARKRHDNEWADRQRTLARARLARFRAARRNDPAWKAANNEYHRKWREKRAA